MLRRTRRRAAFSLVEVLVALFIMAAALIALLSLFPVGAWQMAHAMRDDRSQQKALLADARLRHDYRETVFETPPAGREVNDYSVIAAGMTTFGGQPAVVGAVPSYPILVDSVGYYSYPSKQNWVAGVNNGVHRATPRRLLGGTPTPWNLTTALRYATLHDDMEFAPDGTPADRDGLAVNASSLIFRQGRFTSAALLQRPDNTNPRVVGVKVLVFDRRPAGVDSATAELSWPVNVAVGTTIIDLPASVDAVPLRAGGWIMDATVIDPAPAGQFATPNAGTGIRNGNFYKVQSVADVGGTTTRVELQTPVVVPTGSPNTTTYTGRFVVFEHLIDVYDRPHLTPNGYQKQTP